MLSKWPEEELVPGFKAAMLRYLAGVERLSFEFTDLLAEALGLPPDALKAFYETEKPVQHWAKVVKYPALENLSSDQGVGPHFDAGFLTFVSSSLAVAMIESHCVRLSCSKRHTMQVCRYRTYLESGSMLLPFPARSW